MSKLSPTELAELVTLYKFPDRATAVAVILGESGGDPRATNRQSDNVDRGLWQISSKWHPEVTDAQAYDVQASTEHALRISGGGRDFNPWHATKASTFAGHLRTAEAAVAEYDAKGSGGGGSPWWKKIPITPLGPLGPDIGTITGAGGAVVDAGGAVVGAVTGAVSGVGDVLSYLGKALSLLTSADFWKRAAWALGGLALLVLGFQLMFGRDLSAGFVAARTGGAVDISADDDE